MPIKDWNGDSVSIVRAWIITFLGTAFIVYGMVNGEMDSLFLGFSVLGAEPMIRAGSSK